MSFSQGLRGFGFTYFVNGTAAQLVSPYIVVPFMALPFLWGEHIYNCVDEPTTPLRNKLTCLPRTLPWLISFSLPHPVKHLLILFFFLIAASICHATSNITFSGGGYDISVLLSDEDCKVVGLNVSGDNPNIISIGASELTAFTAAESDCKKKTIHLVVPETTSHPYFELKSTSKRGHMTLGEKKVKVSPDWQM